jgi:hypothetical protein
MKAGISAFIRDVDAAHSPQVGWRTDAGLPGQVADWNSQQEFMSVPPSECDLPSHRAGSL